MSAPATKSCGMPADPPPPTTRFLFWTMGRRVPPEHRAWVAEQLARPDYSRRRLWPSLAFQVLVLVAPVSSALVGRSPLRLVLPALVVAFDVVTVLVVLGRRRPLPEARRRQLLAYHGVTAGGALAPPASLWDTNPLGKAGVVLLSAQVLLFSCGVAVAAYVREGAQRLGPAVWRVIDPSSPLNPTPAVGISAADGLAHLLAPSAGYSSSTPADPAVEKARDCARAAR